MYGKYPAKATSIEDFNDVLEIIVQNDLQYMK
jgi:hypothetical protein